MLLPHGPQLMRDDVIGIAEKHPDVGPGGDTHGLGYLDAFLRVHPGSRLASLELHRGAVAGTVHVLGMGRTVALCAPVLTA